MTIVVPSLESKNNMYIADLPHNYTN
jgi:hypothetical protein